jgi:hypothetical protein
MLFGNAIDHYIHECAVAHKIGGKFVEIMCK